MGILLYLKRKEVVWQKKKISGQTAVDYRRYQCTLFVKNLRVDKRRLYYLNTHTRTY